jgi:leucine dehydrogenase
MENHDTERLLFACDPDSGLRAIIAIHSVERGPAIGGCRFIHYAHETDAINDAVRLAKGMSYKAALAKLPHGGAKAVIIKPRGKFDRAHLMQAFGRFVNTLHGDYITAMDSGTQVSDMDQIHQNTRWVSCTSASGDPSPFTALGVFEGIKASVNFQLKRDNLKGIHVAIQGVGHVGFEVARLLHKAGATLTVADINSTLTKRCVKQFSASVVPPDDIYTVTADVFCPCGLGATLNRDTIEKLQTPIVAGSANNQLKDKSDGDRLHEKQILYAPDYLINSGGVIFVAMQYAAKQQSEIHQHIMGIGPTLLKLYQESATDKQPIHRIADHRAEQVLNSHKTFHSAA